MKINFFIPFISKSGGIISVLELFQHLKKRGHDVILYYPLIPHWSLFDDKASLMLKTAILLKRFLLLKQKITWYFEEIPVHPVLHFSNKTIRDADISVATAWPTAYDVYHLDRNKGVKFYFVQGHEIWQNKNKEDAENSYRLPLRLITISPWLSDIMEKKYGRQVDCEVYNGIRTDKFYPLESKRGQQLTISMQYHELECKGIKEALIALAKVRSEFTDVKIVLFGLFESPQKTFEFNYYRNPDRDSLIEIYQQSDIFLFPSRGEGWGMTPIEAMACKCAVVGTDVGSVKVVGNNDNVFKVEAGNAESIFEGLKTLIIDKQKRKRIAENGYRTIQGLSWKYECEKMEKTFLRVIGK